MAHVKVETRTSSTRPSIAALSLTRSAAGVAREMARMVLPVNLYTQFYWTVNARSLMNFLSLRADSHAQWEIQRYAEALASHFAAIMPWTWSAFLSFAWKGENPSISAGKQAAVGAP